MKNFKKLKNNIILKNLYLSVIPAIIFPIIEIIPFFNKPSKIFFTIIAAIFIAVSVIQISIKEKNDSVKLENKLNDYKKYCVSQKIVNCLSDINKIKRNYLKKDEPLCDVSSNILLYNPHEYIDSVCECLKNLISNITEIANSSLSVSFIYKYPSCKDDKWQWITRKEGTLNQDLNNFIVNEYSNSYFHFLVTNNIASYFENSKEELIKKGNYWISEGDKRYSTLGSIASYKISFIKNDVTRCVGYLTISTYGRKFVENINDNEKINEFNNLLTNSIIPPFRSIIVGELGFLYIRHNLIYNDEKS